MSIKVLKVVSTEYQSDIKFGSSEMALYSGVNSKHRVPKGLLVHLHLPQQSRKREHLVSLGKIDEVAKITGNCGYLRFARQKAEEVLGMLDPQLVGQSVKVATIVYHPDKSTLAEFVEGINWLYDFITTNRKPGVIEKETRIYVFEDYLPTLLTRPLTVEDFSDGDPDDEPIEDKPKKTGRPRRRF